MVSTVLTNNRKQNMTNIDNLIAEAKANPGRIAGALISGSFYRVWTDKQGKVRIARDKDRLSLKNALAAISA